MIAGRYTLARQIGRGGMGAVWLGRDELLGREVALKRIGVAPGASAPDLARAEREAKLAARVNHPHVVAVFDLVDEGDERWLVMEHVEGLDLKALVARDGPLSPDVAARLLGQAAEALAAAHAAGIVHRDVKPSNILVTPSGQVKLSDFGIARAEADPALTQTGLVTGSPAYLAPEVASGHPATDASDVWSLGATLFHALEGRPPYEVTDNVMGAMFRIVNEDPPRPTSPGWLAPLLAATMAKVPAHRWTMRDVQRFLQQPPPATNELTAPRAGLPAAAAATVTAVDPAPLIRDRPAATQSPAVSPPVTASPRRRRSAFWPVLGVVVLVALAALATSLVLGDDPAPPPRTGDAASSQGPTPEPSPTTISDEERAAAMEAFVIDYLAMVNVEPAATWPRLTPDFQKQSGGFDQYRKFWSAIDTIDVGNIDADPTNLTITYDVVYTRGAAQQTDTPTLQLVTDGDSYLIAGER